MKLETKHLAPYLPYKLKVYHKTFNEHSKITKSIIEELTTISYECASFANSMDYYFEDIEDNECDIKPILFPLSALTKEITIYGEKIKIIDKIEILTDKNHFEYILRFLDVDSYEILPYWVMELLFSYKIDIFGLIELGLAEPVTEDFNPYK